MFKKKQNTHYVEGNGKWESMKYNYSAHNKCIFLLFAPSTLSLIKFNLVFALQDSSLINHLNLLLSHRNCHIKQLVTFLVLILTRTAENE